MRTPNHAVVTPAPLRAGDRTVGRYAAAKVGGAGRTGRRFSLPAGRPPWTYWRRTARRSCSAESGMPKHDPQGIRWPRYKRSDDAAVALAVFTEPVYGVPG